MGSRTLCVAVVLSSLGLVDQATEGASARAPAGKLRTACEGARGPLPGTLAYELRGGAFPGSNRPDVAVHVPPGFDATRRPGLILYLHGWQTCVEAALAPGEVACGDAGSTHPGADLIDQVDGARVNALLVAVEVRADAATGEPGRLAMPGGARSLLRELFVDKLAAPLGCALDPDAVDRILVVAHSGGYQAAAAILRSGDLPRVTEVVLLDALYGGQDIFARWIADDSERFDSRAAEGLRFVDLYTCCGGTVGPSRALLGKTLDILGVASVRADDRDSDPTGEDLMAHMLFKRVPESHADLPRVYVRALLENAGFARVSTP
jgi:hypothetical protein